MGPAYHKGVPLTVRQAPFPIGSMYGIFTYIYHKHQLNVGKYTIHGSYGFLKLNHSPISNFNFGTMPRKLRQLFGCDRLVRGNKNPRDFLCHGQGCRYIRDGRPPTFNDGNPYFMGPYFHPYGLGLMSLSPIIFKQFGVDRPQHKDGVFLNFVVVVAGEHLKNSSGVQHPAWAPWMMRHGEKLRLNQAAIGKGHLRDLKIS